MLPPPEIKQYRRSWLKLAASLVFVVLGGALLAIVSFRLAKPAITPVMISEKIRGTKVAPRRWVRFEDISRNLPLAVIASEDGRFCDHWGVDLREVWHASKGGGKVRAGIRGASTIPMQTVKNLYLWPKRSYARKTLEVPLAVLLSAFWTKKEVIETYLNIAPWGRGRVGAEAASRYYFNKSAADLTVREATLLAAALPRPNLRNPAKPSPKMQRLAQSIEVKMRSLASRSVCVLP